MNASLQDTLPIYVAGADLTDPGAVGILTTTDGSHYTTHQLDIFTALEEGTQ